MFAYPENEKNRAACPYEVAATKELFDYIAGVRQLFAVTVDEADNDEVIDKIVYFWCDTKEKAEKAARMLRLDVRANIEVTHVSPDALEIWDGYATPLYRALPIPTAADFTKGGGVVPLSNDFPA